MLWSVRARVFSKYNLVILNAGDVGRSTTLQRGGTDFLTVLVHSKLRNYWGHEIGKKEKNLSLFFLIPSSTIHGFLL